MMKYLISMLVLMICLYSSVISAQHNNDWNTWEDQLDEWAFDYYGDVLKQRQGLPKLSDEVWKYQVSKTTMGQVQDDVDLSDPAIVLGRIRAESQFAVMLEMVEATKAGDVSLARKWRTRLELPRGVSAREGTLILRHLPKSPKGREEMARLLARESMIWRLTRTRYLLSKSLRMTQDKDLAMPDRVREQLAEAILSAAPPQPLQDLIGDADWSSIEAEPRLEEVKTLQEKSWPEYESFVIAMQKKITRSLPIMMDKKERMRREKLMLKLLALIPAEYNAGIRDGVIVIPIEYREAVSFTQQTQGIVNELAPIWLRDPELTGMNEWVDDINVRLQLAEAHIKAKKDESELEKQLKSISKDIQDKLGISLRLTGTTGDIVDALLIETRSLLNQSLTAAKQGRWSEAESLRLEAYTTYDPGLEARLMLRDPQLATDVELLLLDGINHPGVKMLLDQRADEKALEEAYARVHEALDQAEVVLKTGISPGAAVMNAISIVAREGLEGLLVIIAILAGLRGVENKNKRRLVWLGVILAGVATVIAYAISRFIYSGLQSHAEMVEAVTSIFAVVVLLLITNWLFHRLYWNDWVKSLKTKTTEGGTWGLVSVGFFIGYREGFETVLFLQSLVTEAGALPVMGGVTIGMVGLVVLGVLALYFGLRMPYFKLLMVTAFLVGMVLIMFVGSAVRLMQTVGWLPVHKILPVNWPTWLGQWFGVYNTWESMVAQLLAVGVVLGAWRGSRWQAKRKAKKRKEEIAEQQAALQRERDAQSGGGNQSLNTA